jgi:hypothetical protein
MLPYASQRAAFVASDYADWYLSRYSDMCAFEAHKQVLDVC